MLPLSIAAGCQGSAGSAPDFGGCTEKRIFYRLISGMHASISAHISANYLLDEAEGRWGHNLTDFKCVGGSGAQLCTGSGAPLCMASLVTRAYTTRRSRLGRPEVRDRVQNLYFAYLFVLRAVLKVSCLRN